LRPGPSRGRRLPEQPWEGNRIGGAARPSARPPAGSSFTTASRTSIPRPAASATASGDAPRPGRPAPGPRPHTALPDGTPRPTTRSSASTSPTSSSPRATSSRTACSGSTTASATPPSPWPPCPSTSCLSTCSGSAHSLESPFGHSRASGPESHGVLRFRRTHLAILAPGMWTPGMRKQACGPQACMCIDSLVPMAHNGATHGGKRAWPAWCSSLNNRNKHRPPARNPFKGRYNSLWHSKGCATSCRPSPVSPVSPAFGGRSPRPPGAAANRRPGSRRPW